MPVRLAEWQARKPSGGHSPYDSPHSNIFQVQANAAEPRAALRKFAQHMTFAVATPG